MNFAGSSRVYAIDPRNKCGWRIRRCNTQCLDVCGCGWASLRLLASFTMLLGQARIFSLPARSISESAELAARSQLPEIFHTSTTTFDVDILIQYILLHLTLRFIIFSPAFSSGSLPETNLSDSILNRSWEVCPRSKVTSPSVLFVPDAPAHKRLPDMRSEICGSPKLAKVTQ